MVVVTIVKRFPLNAPSPVPCLIGQEQIQRNALIQILHNKFNRSKCSGKYKEKHKYSKYLVVKLGLFGNLSLVQT